jgi:multicomponent Na+:H+ antiporter subunit G
LAGSFFCLTGALGLIRLPDFFSRVHGAGVLDSLGTILVLLGLIVQAGLSLVTAKIVLVMAFLLLTGPTAIHALARAALSGGVNLESVAKRIGCPANRANEFPVSKEDIRSKP